MTDTKCNGWRNRETWLVYTWLTNDEDTFEIINKLTKQAKNRYEAQQSVSVYVLEGMPELNAGIFSDLLETALAAVDWYEIADAFTENDSELEDES